MDGMVGERGPERVTVQAGQKVTPGYAGYRVFPGQIVAFGVACAVAAVAQFAALWAVLT